MSEEVVLRFDEVTFEYLHKKPVVDEASFSVRKGAKITLMGQNGAGKSTIFKLIQGKLKPKKGTISMPDGVTVGTAHQMIAREELDLTLEKYFEQAFENPTPQHKSNMKNVLEAVNLEVPLDWKVRDLSGGQQARLLLAFALIQEPDILLLDEPTNNLDDAGIDHLIQFLIMYDKTVIVISHDADFLNCFTEGVVYLDVFTHKTEQYVGDYYSVVEEISARIERERKQNARLEKQIKDRKEKANFFAHKGGKMRKLASKMKDEIEEAESNKVQVRREDREIKPFEIPTQDISTRIAQIDYVEVFKNFEVVQKKLDLTLRKNMHILVKGPNGIGKSTFIKSFAENKNKGAQIMENTKVGYYSQDFSALDFKKTVYDSLMEVKPDGLDEQEVRAIAAGFLIYGNLMEHKVSDLSEGQKGLLSFARLVLMQPALLILDEPTNHINFRHLPLIAEALDKYQGAMILVSHMPDFVEKIRIDEYIDLGEV